MTDQGGRGLGRWLAIAATAAIVVMWLYIFSGAARRDPPDSLRDGRFAEQAEPICAAAVEAVEALPGADVAETAPDRADVIDDADVLLADMLDQLEALEVDDDRDRELIDLWLADWRTYLGDRAEFARALRTDPDAELLVTARAGRQITLTVDRFAEVNDMASCATPLDV